MILPYQPSSVFTGWDMLTALPPSAQDVLPECRCGMSGLGLFESGFDLTQWGIGEWAIVVFGAYAFFSLVGDIGRARSTISQSGRRKQGRKRRIAKAREDLQRAQGL